MKSYESNRHMSALLFTISLFLLYMILAISVILCGTSIYQKVSNDSQINSNIRTSLSYISEKLRQSDANGAIGVASFSTQDTTIDTIRITSSYNSKDYVTYIYSYNSQLYELFTSTDNTFSPTAGTVLTELKGMQVQLDGSASDLLRITITDTLDTEHTLLFHPQSVAVDSIIPLSASTDAAYMDDAIDPTFVTSRFTQEN